MFDRVFFVSSHGMAGDHWFDWLPKALNAHPEMLVFIGESVRAKYLKERSRKERPPLHEFTQYLDDVGGSVYSAIGECFAYRAYQLEDLTRVHGLDVPWVNIVRHPYAWLHYYVTWRVNNMNMPAENTSGVDHEWRVACHDEFSVLPLRPYTRGDVEIWSTYQGMTILNRMISDIRPGVKNIPLERLIDQPTEFTSLVRYLTRGRVEYDDRLLDAIYGWVDVPFRVAGKVLRDPMEEYGTWPDWKKEAFEMIVKNGTKRMFSRYGYSL